MDFQLIRSATVKLHYNNQTILVDPMLAAKGENYSLLGVNKNPRVNLTMPVSEILDDVDFVLLTHTHTDHYDPAAREQIAKCTPFVVQSDDVEQVAIAHHYRNTTGIVDNIDYRGISITRIRGNHGRGILAEKMGISSGYILSAPNEPTLYIMGDCVWDDYTQEAAKQYSPDIIIVNSGGAILPHISTDDGAILVTEHELSNMMHKLPNTRFIAVHMEALDHCQTTREILRNQALHDGCDMSRLFIPKDGEKIVGLRKTEL